MALNQFLILERVPVLHGIYGVLARRNAVLVLMSIELMLNAVNLNLVAFSAFNFRRNRSSRPRRVRCSPCS